MGVYILILLLAVILLFLRGGASNKSPQTKISLAFMLIVTWIVTAFRDHSVGVDTPKYKQSFEAAGKANYSLDIDWLNLFAVNGFESGFSLYNYTIATISDNFTVFLAISHSLILFLIWRYIKKYSLNYYFSFVIYFSFLLLGSMNHFRQAIAVAIASASIGALISRNPLKYFTIIAVATLFHQSAIILAPLYFLYGQRFTARGAVSLMSVGSLLILAIGPVVNILAALNFRYEVYLTQINSYQLGSIIISGILGGVAGSVIHLSRSIDYSKIQRTTRYTIWLYLYTLIIAFVLSLVAIRFSGFSRSVSYFMLILTVGLPYLVAHMNIKGKGAIVAVYCAIFITYALSLLVLKPEWLGVNPYIWGGFDIQ